MADIEKLDQGEDGAPKKKSKKPVLIGLILAILLGAGGFYAVYSGVILGSGAPHETESVADGIEPGELPPIAFVPIDPLVISLGGPGNARHLRFRAELEVAPAYQDEVASLMPRILDILNSYLRAVKMADLETPSALINLRAQMLRRIQMVTGQGRVRDLLIMEFVLN